MKNITKIKTIADTVFNNVTTDFTAGEILWMAMQSLQIDNNSIQMFTLPGYGAMSTAGTSEAFSFFFPYYNETLELVNEYFNPFTTKITTLSIVSGPQTGGTSSGGSGNYTVSDDDDYTWSNSLESSTSTDTGDVDTSDSTGIEEDPESAGSSETETPSGEDDTQSAGDDSSGMGSGTGAGDSTGSDTSSGDSNSTEGNTSGNTSSETNGAGQNTSGSEGAQSTAPSSGTGSGAVGSTESQSTGAADPEA